MEAMKISEKEEVVNKMLYIASRYGMEYEVKETYNSYIKAIEHPTLEDVRQCAADALDALYEWDI